MVAITSITLTTPRLLLRPLADADAPAVFAIFSHPEVMRYWSSPPFTDLAQAERVVAAALDPQKLDVEIIHLGEAKARVAEARREGVKSVPALVLDGQPFHINFGAPLEALG